MKRNPAIPYEPLSKAAVFSDAIDFPIVTQSKQWTCGPAVVRAMLRFHGIRKSEAALAKMLKTTKKWGTTPFNMTDVLDDFNLLPAQCECTPRWLLEKNLSSGKPVIILWDDWDGHWAVLVGYDKKTKSVMLMDPANFKTGIRIHKLKTLFQNWCAKVQGSLHKRLSIVCHRRK
jgi:ABC-type bacteriocin/lantibiotic exporter with double-glycine peptidase domain